MGLFEFNIKLKDTFGDRLYNIYRNIYRNTIKRRVSIYRTKRKLGLMCDIKYPMDLIEKGTSFPHPYGIVIADNKKIGKNVSIAQGVTIGTKDGGVPTIKNNVIIYPNCVIMGDITVGSGSVIGAGSIVMKDIPQNEVWAGNPARFIRKKRRGKNNDKKS